MEHLDNYQLNFFLWFEIYGTEQAPVTKERGDPLIKWLRGKLENFRYENGTIKAWVESLDFDGAQIAHLTLAQGRFSNVRFQVVDESPDDSERTYTFNNRIRGAIGQELMKLAFSRYHTFLKVVKIESS